MPELAVLTRSHAPPLPHPLWSAKYVFAQFWAIVLIVALLGEVAVALYFRENRSRAETALAVSLAFAVALGVIGETIYGNRVEDGTFELLRASEERVAIANRDAAEAGKTAAEVRERAAKLENENLQLQARLVPRDLSPRHRRDIAAKLSRFAGQPVRILGFALDALHISSVLADVLTKANWAVDEPINETLNSGGRGISIWLHLEPTQSAIEAAEALALALSEHGLEASVNPYRQCIPSPPPISPVWRGPDDMIVNIFPR